MQETDFVFVIYEPYRSSDNAESNEVILRLRLSHDANYLSGRLIKSLDRGQDITTR
jgi:hypothetical protein